MAVGKRIAQINHLIQQELGAIFLREMDLPRGTIVTIMRVETARDLENATVWISILPQTHREELFALARARLGYFQKLLSEKLVMQFPPKLTLKLDLSEEKADRVLRLLDKLERKP